MSAYLDCNATTPLDDRVHEAMRVYALDDFGNAGSRTHAYGRRARDAVERARAQVAAVVNAHPRDVVFTSGATESNNLALRGLAQYGESTGRRHILSSQIEHKSVLAVLEALSARGFEVSLVPPTSDGLVQPDEVRSALRTDTLLVSIMHANNETGAIQPIAGIAEALSAHEAFFHVDAAQGFGKEIAQLRNSRIDMVSVSGHKIFGPKGVGALITRRRGHEYPPLEPLLYGGGQERGLRSGTQPVPLIVGLGKAAELALEEVDKRHAICAEYRQVVLDALSELGPVINGSPDSTLPHVLNLSFPGVDSEALILSVKDLIAISNGSACTSQDYEPSHVLRAMGVNRDVLRGAVRLSWCHMTEHPDWEQVALAIGRLA